MIGRGIAVTDTAADPAEIRALAWRCRRGMRELDQLLVNFLHDHYASAEPGLQREFVRLLELQDPVIFGYLVRGERPDDAGLCDIITAILGSADARRVRT